MSVGIRVVKGIVEIPAIDPFLRSFIVPSNEGNCRVNVWSNSRNEFYTVGTYLNHPIKGKTQLFRRACTESEVLEILKNPRKHTGKGYYRK